MTPAEAGAPHRHRRLAGILMAVAVMAPPALAHEPVDAAGAQQILERVTALQQALAAGESPAARSEALLALGTTVNGAVEILNRDLAWHQGELGLAASTLRAGLEQRGVGPEWSPAAGRYRSYLQPFERYLASAPAGARRADALLALLRGRFYDGFGYDPLQPYRRDWPSLHEQIAMGEAFLADHPQHPAYPEARFIVAVSYVRAAREAPDAADARDYAQRAHAALTAFARAYPEDLRAVAAEALLTRLPPAE
jgi:hypothetical protein